MCGLVYGGWCGCAMGGGQQAGARAALRAGPTAGPPPGTTLSQPGSRGGGVVLGGEVGGGLDVGDGGLHAVQLLKGWGEEGGAQQGGMWVCGTVGASEARGRQQAGDRRRTASSGGRRQVWRAGDREPLGSPPALPASAAPSAAPALPARRTLMSSWIHLASSKVQEPMSKVMAMEWPTKVAGTFSPAGWAGRCQGGAAVNGGGRSTGGRRAGRRRRAAGARRAP